MQTQILLYTSTTYVSQVTTYLMMVVTAGISFRCICDLINAYYNTDLTIKQTLIKCKNRIFRVIVAATATSLVAFFGLFYQ